MKICDFGMSKYFTSDEKFYEKCGTPAYIAPEILKKEGYRGEISDIWSVGMVLYLLIYGTLPFSSLDINDITEYITKKKINFPDEISVELRDFFEKSLNINPHERFNAYSLLHHPWIKTSDEKSILN